ncbi:hypothetical protein KGF56_004298 [Candida oxycetoniae]|uniref:DNA replication regulator Sld3 C-terminal domain-containing protein n=1 Tax=Candida oxycetoniae TaxID=497107 RepID=A0AAI9STQ1_9ASCO|nr:uncharacterized protein KGF56_004298 [Candida oxycetoniae]KAI3402837.2 hypothetical protein KGF56_004298 [Candida oxycetoniae]
MIIEDEVTFTICDQNLLQIQITALHTVDLKSVLKYIPLKASFEQGCKLMSEGSSTIHLFRASSSKIRQCLYLCKLKLTTSDKVEKFGILYPVFDDIFAVFRIPRAIDKTGRDLEQCCSVRKQEDLTGIFVQSSDLVESSVCDVVNFSMKPPNSGITISEEQQDPYSFLQSKYYHSLYALGEPLNYFPKTALTRFRNLCQDEKKIGIVLKSMILTIEDFDRRYEPRFIDILENPSATQFERKSMEKLKEKLGVKIQDGSLVGITSDSVQKVVLELKVRESQLQIVLLLELLETMRIKEATFLEENLRKHNKLLKKTKALQKVTLVRSKKKKQKRVVPTQITGVGVSGDNRGISTDTSSDWEFSLYSYLNKLIDRLNLWEVLLSNKDANNSNNNNSHGFMAYVLIPYYHKRLPLVMKYVIENLKTVNMKLTSSRKKVAQDSKEANPIKRPTLKQDENDITTSLLDDISVKPLKRSMSNLGQPKDMDRRQVDLNVNVNAKSLVKQQKQAFQEESTYIFGQVKRSKSIAHAPSAEIMNTPMKEKGKKAKLQTLSFSQVQATPAKRQLNNETEIYTPDNREITVFSSPTDTFAKPELSRFSMMTRKLQNAAAIENVVDATPKKKTMIKEDYLKEKGDRS